MVETPALSRPDAQRHTREATSYAERYRAPFSLRCGAMLIDYILVASIMVCSTLAARLVGSGARSSADAVKTIGWAVAVGVILLNFIVLAGLRGHTLGKWATGLRITQRDGKPLTLVSALLRHVVGYPLSLLTLGLGFLIAVFDSRGRALHDIIAGTVVVLDKARSPRT
jgi:uncharacterized RDD family membrane protein YckC